MNGIIYGTISGRKRLEVSLLDAASHSPLGHFLQDFTYQMAKSYKTTESCYIIKISTANDPKLHLSVVFTHLMEDSSREGGDNIDDGVKLKNYPKLSFHSMFCGTNV